jgi:hypothetical protein
LAWGQKNIRLKSTDTLESLAVEHFGDPDMAILIATFNNIPNLNGSIPGDVIKIPITDRTVRMSNNQIFSRPEDRDNYGKDIFLTDEGFIDISNTGDYQLTGGVKNLNQAILLRLRESVSKRVRINTYGIRNNVSDPVAGTAYIMSSIKMTVNSDPRVASVDNIRFRGERDYLNVNVFYQDINGATSNVSGRL